MVGLAQASPTLSSKAHNPIRQRLGQYEDPVRGPVPDRSEGLNLVGENGLLKGLVKLVLEGALEAEMSEHLGYEKGDKAGAGSGNSRNGTSRKRS